ncbi:restriction endonuclease subunit S [Staphylococcus sp. Marseille-Q1834]|uniref:restriction endonuclease subunit S n=1 Tax=Staphylococcus sp. Marseille-Q1834 TaxID=2866594 RepID=UPI001CF8CC19|nr:restriction endonuclease subunit S [Staphylococcus sp. Marseille-Q1834]
MTEHIKTPELRFSNFLDMWHIHKLSDVATITGGGTPSTKVSEYWNGEIDWYTPNEIGESIYARGSKKKITNLGYKKSSTKLLPINTILFTSRAGIGNTAILAKEGCTNQGFQSIIPNSEKIDSYFIYTISNHIKKYALKHAAGSTFLEISGKELGKMKLFLPSLKEQQKIGVFFSKLDRQIELEEEKLELLEQQKKGYMQKVFSQELRFKDENGNDYPDWKLKKLSNVADIIGGGTPSTKKSEYWDGDINWFSPVEIGDKEFVSTSQRRITEKGLEKSSAKMLPIGTVLFTSRAGIGKTAILSKEATTNQGFQSIVPKENDLDSYFLYSMTSILKRKAEKVGAGSTFSEVSRKQMEQIKLLIPILKEQKQIGRLFQIINRKINKQIHKIELLKHRKQGLLQRMFI